VKFPAFIFGFILLLDCLLRSFIAYVWIHIWDSSDVVHTYFLFDVNCREPEKYVASSCLRELLDHRDASLGPWVPGR
jgi:hypothetical protein